MCDTYQVGGIRTGIKAKTPGDCAWCEQHIASGDPVSVATFQEHDNNFVLVARRYHPECAEAMDKYFGNLGECYYPPMKRGLPESAEESNVAW